MVSTDISHLGAFVNLLMIVLCALVSFVWARLAKPSRSAGGKTPLLFATGLLVILILDIVDGNTIFVFTNNRFFIASIVFGFYYSIYRFWFSVTRRFFMARLTYVQFWTTFIGFNLLTPPLRGFSSVIPIPIRRVARYEDVVPPMLQGISFDDRMRSLGGILLISSMLLFLVTAGMSLSGPPKSNNLVQTKID